MSREKSGSTRQDSSGPVGVKSEQAGLLWRMLPPSVRRNIARLLSAEELALLNGSFKAYRARDAAGRRGVELSLLRATDRGLGSWPVVVFCLLSLGSIGLYVYHLQLFPVFPEMLRLQLFGALAIGCVSPLALYLVPAYRLRVLLRPPPGAEPAAIAFAGFLGLLWMMYYIQAQTPALGVRPSGPALWAACIASLCAPVAEELFFREVLPSVFGTTPHYAGHVVASLLFAAMHVPSGPGMFLMYVVCAFLLVSVRLHSEGLLYPYLIHAGANLTHQILF